MPYELTPEDYEYNATWVGFPTSPELRKRQEEASRKRVALIKQQLVDIGYTDAEGNVLRPEMAVIPDNTAPIRELRYTRPKSEPAK